MTTEGRTQPAARSADRVQPARDGAGDRPSVDRAHQRERFGGLNWGASFFGWLVAVGVTALLTALLSAAGAAIGLTQLSDADARSSADTISIVGGALLIAVLAIGYYAGGYVAGRMSRFDGGRQGFGAWLIGVVATIVLAVAGAVAGSEYNLLGQLDLPRIPIDEGSLASGAAIALVIVLVATLLAAVAGGKVGRRYHTKVDRAGMSRA
jgi:MFS family permease